MPTIQTIQNKKSTSYRVQFMRDGKRVSKRFKLKKEAQKFAAQLLVNEDFASSFTDHTLNTLTLQKAVIEYLDQYKGKDTSIIQRLNFWCSLYGDKPVGKLTSAMVRSELKKLISSGKQPPTANRYKSALGSLFSYLADEYDIEYNPTRNIKQFTENNGRTRFLTDGELSRLLKACKQSGWDRLYLLVLMAVSTGARRTELLTLEWSDIDFKARTAQLKNTKNGEQRILTLTPAVISELMTFRGIDGYVFPHERQLKGYFRNFDCYWREALTEAEITNFRFHDLRHTCASMLAMNGASLLEIAQVLGHKSITMTQRYSHLCTEHKASLTDRVFGGIANG